MERELRVDVRDDRRHVGQLFVPRVRAVDQHDRRRRPLGRPQQLLEEQRVALAQPDVRITEARVDLHGCPEVGGHGQRSTQDEVTQGLGPAMLLRMEKALRGVERGSLFALNAPA